MQRQRMLFVIFFALLGGVLSVSLLMHHHGVGAGGGVVEMICGSGTDAGCSAVDSSAYSSILGFPLAALGIFFYSALALLFSMLLFTDADTRRAGQTLGFWTALAGLVVDLILFALQLFVVGRFCAVCLLTYACTAAMLILIRRPGGAMPAGALKKLAGSREGKIVIASLAQGVAILAVAVVMANLALSNADVRKIEGRLMEQAVAEFNAAPVRTVAGGDAPTLGRADAPIQVMVFSDFLCPWCRQTAQFFQRHMDQWRDRVRVTFLNYPLDKLCNTRQKSSVHPGSCWSALGGLCAQRQGRFWEFHDRIFSDPPVNPSGQDIMKIAYGAGIDTTVMKACMVSIEMRKKVQVQINEAASLGVTGTPQIFINGRLVPKLAALGGILKSEAGRLGLAPLEGLED